MEGVTSLLGGDLVSSFVDFAKIFAKFAKQTALPFARQIRPLPLALAEFRLHSFPNRNALKGREVLAKPNPIPAKMVRIPGELLPVVEELKKLIRQQRK